MTVVWFRCDNCGAEPHIDATLLTVVIDLTTGLASDRASVPYVCPLCGTTGETGWLGHDIQTRLFDGGAAIAVRG